MKTFNVNATVKGKETSIELKANTAEDAKQIARRKLEYEIKGSFFPLHGSEIRTCQRVK